MVGAHYDTDGPYPGADDNASGVAGLLELARLLAGEPLTRRVELIAFALEEVPSSALPLWGADPRAQLREANAECARCFLSRCSAFSDEPGSQTYPFRPCVFSIRSRQLHRGRRATARRGSRSPDQRSMLSASDLQSPRSTPRLPSRRGSLRPREFWDAGYPAGRVTDRPSPEPAVSHAADTPDTSTRTPREGRGGSPPRSSICVN